MSIFNHDPKKDTSLWPHMTTPPTGRDREARQQPPDTSDAKQLPPDTSDAKQLPPDTSDVKEGGIRRLGNSLPIPPPPTGRDREARQQPPDTSDVKEGGIGRLGNSLPIPPPPTGRYPEARQQPPDTSRKPVKIPFTTKLYCYACHHEWISTSGGPLKCPKCNSKKWNHRIVNDRHYFQHE